jgi:hypothetical protein
MATSTSVIMYLPSKDGTDYSLPVTTYLKSTTKGWNVKKNEFPSLEDKTASKNAWDRIIPNLDNSDFQKRLDKINEFLLLYPKPRDFFEAYKATNPSSPLLTPVSSGTSAPSAPSGSSTVSPSGIGAAGGSGGSVSSIGVGGVPTELFPVP